MERKRDVVVIGGGITGTAILAALARLELSCVLVEKEPDIAAGTTKANSAILHAGFDAPTGSMKAKMNVEGNRLYHELQKDLDLDIRWTGSFVCAATEEEEKQIEQLLGFSFTQLLFSHVITTDVMRTIERIVIQVVETGTLVLLTVLTVLQYHIYKTIVRVLVSLGILKEILQQM